MASKHAFGSASVGFLHKLSSTCAPAHDNEAFATYLANLNRVSTVPLATVNLEEFEILLMSTETKYR